MTDQAKEIPPFILIPKPANEAAKKLSKFKWAPDKVGHRHKLGGTPDFIQKENWPTCPTCKNKMSFYAQLDSINDEFIIADCGMVYIFICFDCNESKSVIQSY